MFTNTKSVWNHFVIPLILTLWVGSLGVAQAGVGQDVSPLVTLDTEPPWVNVDQLPEFSSFLGGEMVIFHWQTGDTNPSQIPEYFTASVVIDGQDHSSIIYHPDTDDFTWEWLVPELTSSDVHLEVLATDAFGYSTVGTTNSFRVYANVADIPNHTRNFGLDTPAPNPFNPSTRLSFHLPEPGSVTLTVYNPRGHRVRTLLQGRRQEGDFSEHWDGRDDLGRAQSGGVYVFVLDFQGSTRSGRMTQKAVLIP